MAKRAWLATAMFITCLSIGRGTTAGDDGLVASPGCEAPWSTNACQPCGLVSDGLFGHCRHGLLGHRHCKADRYEGQDPLANCSCNGSYKFPVPPLSTYHWPGMWQQHLMTDYHSPYRFPPLKPYSDEVLPTVPTGTGPIRSASATSATLDMTSEPEPRSFSSRVHDLGR